ncbi:MAG TPA: glycosyl hydrolase, partial [Opitutaceae bacterium]
IKADLTAMKEAGIAGVQLFDAGIYLPAGPVRYGTDDWHEHVQFAIETAAELGLEVSLMNTPGWSASGGPWVTPEQSMKQLVWSELDVPGGTPLAVDLPLPATRENFYRDVAVLAVPADADASNALRSPALQSASAAGGASLGAAAFDGDRATSVALDARTQKLEFVFAQPVTVAQLTLELRDAKPGFNFRGTIETSNDGTTFRETHAFSFGPHAQASAQIVTSFKPTRATHVRLSFSAGLDSKPVAFSIAELALANPPRLADWRLKTKLASGAISRSTASARTAAIPRERILDLTTAADAEGRLATTLPAGRWTVLRFGFTSTGARNHPAVPEGHGLEIDKLDADAVAFQFEQSVGRIIRAAGPRAGTTLTGVLFDSFEAGFQNWTEKFPARFRAACGYDLVPLLPALTGRVIESPAFTECVLHDFRHVVDDGLAKSYFGAMRALAHRQRLVTYAEAQGGPLNPVLINPYVDVVMNEFWHHNRFDARLKLSASTVNILDRKVLAAEAFSARPEEDGWAATLRDLKRPGNDAFAAGVNRCILHTYAHQPFTEAAPGFTLGRYGTRFGRLNTWWRHLRTWTDFLSRSQFLLQQGWRPADVLFLQTEDMGYAYPANEVEAFPEGYDFDIGYPKDLAAMTLRDGALTLPHGPAYRLVVTPRMPWAASVATLRHLRAHVRAGQSLLGEPPTGPAGVRDLEQRREFETLVGEIWGDLDGSAVREKKLGEGMVMRGRTIAEALATIGVSRDLSWDSGTEQRSVKFTHRRTAEADIYFVFNNTADARFIEFAFRTTGRRPEIWDPESGSRGDAAIFSVGEHTVNVPLQLAPHGATFVVFRKALPEKWATRATSGNGGTPPLEMSAGKLYAATGSRISLELSDGTLRELPSVSA